MLSSQHTTLNFHPSKNLTHLSLQEHKTLTSLGCLLCTACMTAFYIFQDFIPYAGDKCPFVFWWFELNDSDNW